MTWQGKNVLVEPLPAPVLLPLLRTRMAGVLTPAKVSPAVLLPSPRAAAGGGGCSSSVQHGCCCLLHGHQEEMLTSLRVHRHVSPAGSAPAPHRPA